MENLDKNLIDCIKGYPAIYQGKELQYLIWADLSIWLSLGLLQKIRED